MINNCRITLANVRTAQDESSGQRTKIVESVITLSGEKSTVGVNTFWNATANDIRLDFSVLIRSKAYANQKYVYMSGEVYEVYNTAKGASPVNIQLNLKRIVDESLKELIENALGLV